MSGIVHLKGLKHKYVEAHNLTGSLDEANLNMMDGTQS